MQNKSFAYMAVDGQSVVCATEILLPLFAAKCITTLVADKVMEAILHISVEGIRISEGRFYEGCNALYFQLHIRNEYIIMYANMVC